jgi:hypothetical protein
MPCVAHYGYLWANPMNWPCPACPQMIITNGQQQSSRCLLFITQHIEKCQEKILYVVSLNIYAQQGPGRMERPLQSHTPVDEFAKKKQYVFINPLL